MQTLVLAAFSLGLLHCGGGVPRAAMPASLEGGWTRESMTSIRAEDAPESLRRLGATGGNEAAYALDGRRIPVRLYEMPSTTAAFEAQQTYTRTAGEYYFQMGASFVVVDANALRSEEQRPFLMAFLAASMPEGSNTQE